MTRELVVRSSKKVHKDYIPHHEIRGIKSAESTRRKNFRIEDVAVPTRKLTVAGHAAVLSQPRNARALFVFAHGAGAGMHHEFMLDVTERLERRSIATLRWEFAYMTAGKSRPDRADVAEASVRGVWDTARKRFGSLPMFAGGKSFGGRMTSRAHAASPLADLRGLVFLGFPLHPPEKPGIERAEHLAQASGPMLFLQGTRDDLAQLALLRPVVSALGDRATLHVIDGADHGFDVLVRSGRTRDDVREELAETLSSWMQA